MKNSHKRILTLQKEAQLRQQKHLQRLQSISSPKKKAKSRLDNVSLRSKQRNILREKQLKAQNDRLYRKLSQINDRRGSYWHQLNDDDSNYLTINRRSRQIYRKQKNLQIQNQNNLFVERLLQKVGNSKSIFTGESRKVLKKSRIKSKSVIPSSLDD